MDSEKLQELVDDLGSQALEEEQKAPQQEPVPGSSDNLPSSGRQGHLKLLLCVALVCIAVLFWRMANLEQSLASLYAKIAEWQSQPEHKKSNSERDRVSKSTVTEEQVVIPDDEPQLSDTPYNDEPSAVGNIAKNSELLDQTETPSNGSSAGGSLPAEDNTFTLDSNTFTRTVQISADLNRVVCLLDYAGKSGSIYAAMEELTPSFKQLGIKPVFSAYTNVIAAENSFNKGDCDLLMLPDYFVRKYNTFTSTFSAVGAIPDYEHLKTVLAALATPKAAKFMLNGAYEIVGILPVGASFFYVNDREIKRPQNLKNLRMAVADDAPELSYIANLLEMPPTSVGSNKPVAKVYFNKVYFNNGIADITSGTETDYAALEMHQGLGENGGILQFPIQQVTMQLIARRENLPSASFAQSLREMFFALHRTILRRVNTIPENYKIPVQEEIVAEWHELFRKVRISLRDQSIYDPKALKLFRTVRCKVNPSLVECTSSGSE